MAIFQGTYLSDCLKRSITFHTYIPNDVFPETKTEYYQRPTKVLYLLIGYSGTSFDWISGSLVQEIAQKYNLAVIMVSGENSFYLNQKGTGRAYADFVGKELVSYVQQTFHLSSKREDTYIGGVSMGGFGAIHTGLQFYDKFSKIIALSSALIIHDIKNQSCDFQDKMADYNYYVSVFGNLNDLEKSDNNPETLILKMKENNNDIPSIYMACGTEDFLLNQNRRFHSFLNLEHIPTTYIEGPGTHNWTFWNKYLDHILYQIEEDNKNAK